MVLVGVEVEAAITEPYFVVTFSRSGIVRPWQSEMAGGLSEATTATAMVQDVCCAPQLES